MTVSDVLVTLLVVAGVGVIVLSTIGVLVMSDPYDRLHYTGPANTVGVVLIALAVMVDEGVSAVSAKVALIAAIVLLTNPLLVHATARAGRVREHGGWMVRDEEEQR